MTCPLCFFKKTTQRELKENCLKLKLDRFEDRLKKYKELFITGLSEMKTVSECHCKEELNIPIPDDLRWFDDFRENLVSKTSLIEDTFDELSMCYHYFLDGNPMKAHYSLWQFMNKSQLINSGELSRRLLKDKLLFRGRKVKEPINKNLKNTDLFHIPFNKRELVSHGRFSVSGQPMLYCGFSSFIVAKELDATIDELAMIAFLPKEPLALSEKIFGLTSIHETFSVVYSFSDKVQIDYYDGTNAPNATTFERDIKQTILLELCTFPRPHQKEDKFIAEYMLPQMLSSVLMSNGYKGIIYPSTKDCSDLTGVHTFSTYDLNVALFVNYHPEKMHDEKLLDSFETALYPHCKDSEIPDVSIATVVEQLDAYAKPHYEYLQDSELKGIQKKYFETPFGKTELALHKNILGWGDCHRIQILRDAEDRPLFAVIPFAQYQASQKKLNNTLELDIPVVIVNLALENDYSAARAWREHLKLTQEEVAKRMEITQDAYAQLEAKETVRKSSREKIAKALGIHESQLNF